MKRPKLTLDIYLMIGDSRLLAIITARGGSKRLPRKNISVFNGQPLIAWSVKAGKNSQYVDRLILSTDDNETAQIAKSAGAEIPFKRPGELALDSTSSIDVVVHAINELAARGDIYEYVLLLQPTSPLRSARHIDEAVELLVDKDATGIISVTEVDHPYEWSGLLSQSLSMDDFLQRQLDSQSSQNLPVRYRVNGAIYIAKVDQFIKEKSFFLSSKLFAYKMDREVSVDIDTRFDFQFAEFLAVSSDLI